MFSSWIVAPKLLEYVIHAMQGIIGFSVASFSCWSFRWHKKLVACMFHTMRTLALVCFGSWNVWICMVENQYHCYMLYVGPHTSAAWDRIHRNNVQGYALIRGREPEGCNFPKCPSAGAQRVEVTECFLGYPPPNPSLKIKEIWLEHHLRPQKKLQPRSNCKKYYVDAKLVHFISPKKVL